MNRSKRRLAKLSRWLLWVMLLAAGGAQAVELVYPVRVERSALLLKTRDGRPLGKGSHEVERISDGVFKVSLSYHFTDGRSVTEVATLRDKPELEQLSWQWEERSGGRVQRRFEADLATGAASAFKQGRDKPQRWSEQLPVVPGETFAGVGFVYALQNLQPRLDRGETIDLKAIGMTPRPRLIGVKLRQVGEERLAAGGRPSVDADHYTLRPDFGPILDVVLPLPTFEFWFSRDRPPTLLRTVSTMAEAADQVLVTEPVPEPPRSG